MTPGREDALASWCLGVEYLLLGVLATAVATHRRRQQAFAAAEHRERRADDGNRNDDVHDDEEDDAPKDFHVCFLVNPSPGPSPR